MAIEVFNRYEKKYMMDEDTFYKLTTRIADYMNPDAYNRNGEAYRISNIYYDTENDQLIRASIEKPVYKEKLRLRAYGTPELTDTVFVEIKKKYNGIVNKRRTSMTLKDAYDYLDSGVQPDFEHNKINRQVLK
ncbi:MAG: VTC domain-containing protein, partial [Lachnospira sp.]|nr:VTC domain-containing protein [Lachnospira sp.]